MVQRRAVKVVVEGHVDFIQFLGDYSAVWDDTQTAEHLHICGTCFERWLRYLKTDPGSVKQLAVRILESGQAGEINLAELLGEAAADYQLTSVPN